MISYYFICLFCNRRIELGGSLTGYLTDKSVTLSGGTVCGSCVHATIRDTWDRMEKPIEPDDAA